MKHSGFLSKKLEQHTFTKVSANSVVNALWPHDNYGDTPSDYCVGDVTATTATV